MARPLKKGLDYFPLDVNFLRDDDIRGLRSQYGSTGVLIYIAAVCEMYKNGYYAVLDETLISKIVEQCSGKYPATAKIVREVIDSLAECGLVVYLPNGRNGKIITAHRVQCQYYLASRRRKMVTVDRALWLLTKEEMEAMGADNPVYLQIVNVDNNSVNVNNNPVNVYNNTQREREIDIPPCYLTSCAHARGERKNVILSDEEYQALVDEFGKRDTDRMIVRFSDKIAIKGYTYASHYKAIRDWLSEEIEKQIDREMEKVYGK